MEPTEELVRFFKVMSDVNRLKMIGLLASQSYSVEELAALLELNASTVSHHLNRLEEVDLVSARADGYYNVYSLKTENLEKMAKRLLAKDALPELAADIDPESFDKKVIRDFSLPDGRFKTIPAQRKKLDAVLRFLVRLFEPGRDYPEKEVNEIIARYHEDTASLRRELIGSGLMDRQNNIYRRKGS